MNSCTLKLPIAAVILVAALGSRTSFAQSLEDRVQELERRVQQLESKERGGPAVSKPKQGGGDGWRNKANWRSLTRGLSQSEVRRILGEPETVDAGGITFWYYPSGGSAHFDSRGALMGWSEPR